MLKHFYKVLTYDFLNKYNYLLITKIPVINKFVLILNVVTFNDLINNLFMLNIFYNYEKKVILKLKSGTPFHLKIVFKKFDLYAYLNKFIINAVIYKNKQFINNNYIYSENLIYYENSNLKKNTILLNIVLKFKTINSSELKFIIKQIFSDKEKWLSGYNKNLLNFV